MMEPWDGPAAILFSDGDVLGAALDRNGLRPARYCVTAGGRLILASETGVLDLDERQILRKGRLHPGKMLLADLAHGELLDDDAVRERYAAQRPYGEWLDQNLLHLRDVKVPNQKVPALPRAESARLQRAFGYTYEEYRDTVRTMALNGAEPIGAMGRRHAAGRALAAVPAAVLLFPADVRPGHQPAHRRTARKDRDLHRCLCGQKRRFIGAQSRKLPRAQDRPPDLERP